MGDHRLFADFSDKELETELMRRRDEANKKPVRIQHTEWKKVSSYVEEAIESIHSGERVPKDFEHYLMETVLEAMYGVSIWKWWNDKQ